jgi:arsenite methyltransferase
MKNPKSDEIRSAVRENDQKVAGAGRAGCGCSPSSCCGTANGVTGVDISLGLGYSGEDVTAVLEGGNMGLGCGNPQAIASLHPGEVVLDSGSGGRFDFFPAAWVVGGKGVVIGADMTAEMISKARRNAEQTGFANIRIRPKDESKSFIRDRAPGSRVEEYIVATTITVTAGSRHIFSTGIRQADTCQVI